MTFAPGAQNRNGGKPKNSPFRAAIRRHLKAHPDKLDQIAKSLIDSAATGDIQSIKEFADRVDGKAMQPINAQADLSGKIIVGWETDDE